MGFPSVIISDAADKGEWDAEINHAGIPIVSRERLIEVLSYDPETGVFVWLSPPKYHPRMLGKEAGGRQTGYLLIKIDGRKYKAHRLAWLHFYGKWPAKRLDHADGDTFNNSIVNLREADQGQNGANKKRKRGKSLPKGVRKTPYAFVARISFKGKQIPLGSFKNEIDAEAAYAAAANRLYGEFSRTS